MAHHLGKIIENANITLFSWNEFSVTVNSLWSSDAIWHHETWSRLVQVMAWCLMAPSHYLNEFWLILSKVLHHSREGNFTGNVQYICLWHEFKNYWLRSQTQLPAGSNELISHILWHIQSFKVNIMSTYWFPVLTRSLTWLNDSRIKASYGRIRICWIQGRCVYNNWNSWYNLGMGGHNQGPVAI